MAEGAEVTGRRILAGIIDIVLLGIVFIILAALVGDSKTSGSSFSFHLGSVGTVLWLVISLGYYFALESTSGQTLGKRVVGIRVARVDGGELPSGGLIAVRTVLRIIDALPFLYLLGIIVILVTGRRAQRIGDLAAGTTVVKA